jgi:hypothetical protein
MFLLSSYFSKQNIDVFPFGQRFEVVMLNALTRFPFYTTSSRVSVNVPQHFLFLDDTNTQIIQDIPNAIDLKSILVAPTAGSILDQNLATSIGHALGSWLRSFHNWTSQSAQIELCKEFKENEPMRKLKSSINYGRLIQILQGYPDILEGHIETMKLVQNLATKEFLKSMEDKVEENWGLIHGDFWSGT